MLQNDNDPTVSIVIPCYNGEAFLRESIDSALGQSYASKEVIVVDDGSTDGSPRIIKEYGDRIRVITQENSGLPAARNSGIVVSEGSLLAFLDADDYWEVDFLSKMVAALEHSGADIAYCGWQCVGLSDNRGKPFIPPDYSQIDKVALLLRNTRWPVHGALSRRKLITGVGGFNPNLNSCEDFDLWLRVAPFCTLVRVPEVLAYYRFHQGPQITKNHVRIARDLWMVQREFIEKNRRVVAHLSDREIAELTNGELLRKAYLRYWQRDIESARAIFRIVMRTRYGKARDWKYMLPSLLPLRLHQMLIRLADRSCTHARNTDSEIETLTEVPNVEIGMGPHLGASTAPPFCGQEGKPVEEQMARAKRPSTSSIVSRSSRHCPPARVPVLMYHRVGEAHNDWEARYSITPANFAAHMQTLANQGYRAIDIDALVAWLEGGPPLPPGALLVTFDDGFCGVGEHALPTMEALGWPFTVFLVSDLIGREDFWMRGRHPAGISYPLLNESEIRDMQHRGVSFHSHTRSHADLTTLDNLQLAHELADSRNALAQLLGQPVAYIAYPFGRFDERVEAATRAAGYRAAFSTQPGFNRPNVNRFQIRRLDIFGTDTPAMLLRKIQFGSNDGSLGKAARYYFQQLKTRLPGRGR